MGISVPARDVEARYRSRYKRSGGIRGLASCVYNRRKYRFLARDNIGDTFLMCSLEQPTIELVGDQVVLGQVLQDIF